MVKEVTSGIGRWSGLGGMDVDSECHVLLTQSCSQAVVELRAKWWCPAMMLDDVSWLPSQSVLLGAMQSDIDYESE